MELWRSKKLDWKGLSLSLPHPPGARQNREYAELAEVS